MNQYHNSIRYQQSLPPTSFLKQNFTVPYDINSTNDFPNMTNNNKKQKNLNERTREVIGNVVDIPIIASITNVDNISILIEQNNKS